MAQTTVQNVHGARRYLHQLVRTGKAHELELVYPNHIRVSDRIFAVRRRVSTHSISHSVPTVSAHRRERLLSAAKHAAKAVRKVKRTQKKSTSLSAQVQALQQRVGALERRKTSATDKSFANLEGLVDVVDATTQEFFSLRSVVNDNFSKAERMLARDERMLHSLSKDVKTSLKPKLSMHERDIAQLQHKMKKIEAFHKVLLSTDVHDSVELRALSDRMHAIKQKLQKMDLNS